MRRNVRSTLRAHRAALACGFARLDDPGRNVLWAGNDSLPREPDLGAPHGAIAVAAMDWPGRRHSAVAKPRHHTHQHVDDGRRSHIANHVAGALDRNVQDLVRIVGHG